MQVSPWSTHPDLSEKNRFPYFFRTVPPDTHQAAAIVRLLVEQGWSYASIVYENDFYGLQGYRGIFTLTIASTLPLKEKVFIQVVG